MTELRDATPGDVARIVEVHERAFPTEFLTSLGPAFLSWYYKHAIGSPTGLCLVAEIDEELVGFVCGSISRDEHDRDLLRSSSSAFRAAISVVLGRPQRIPALIKRFLWLGGERAKLVEHDIELASLATDPGLQGRGVGKALVYEFASRSAQLGQSTISLTTNEHGNDHVVRFYENLGFTRVRTFERDRPMLQFVAESRLLR